jgi:hypothetical protein
MLDLLAGRFFSLSRVKKIPKFYTFFVDFCGADMVLLYNGMVAKILFLNIFPL